MKYFCTVSDKNFWPRVCALNHSLKKFNNNYRLLTLCIDFDNTIIGDDNIICFNLKDLLESDSLLQKCQDNPPSAEALRNRTFNEAKNTQFIWSLASYFSSFCLSLDYVTDDLLYIDADIYFFDDWSKIYQHVNNIDIGLVEHRMPWTGNSGKYNVGIVYFKKNINGINCANFWKKCLLDTNNQFYKDYGICGDQKYLELFPILFKNVESLDNNIGHLAPWNLPYHSYTDKQIIWNQQLQNVMYYHFSNFTYNDKTFSPAPRHHIEDVSSVPLLQSMHEEYHEILKYYA